MHGDRGFWLLKPGKPGMACDQEVSKRTFKGFMGSGDLSLIFVGQHRFDSLLKQLMVLVIRVFKLLVGQDDGVFDWKPEL